MRKKRIILHFIDECFIKKKLELDFTSKQYYVINYRGKINIKINRTSLFQLFKMIFIVLYIFIYKKNRFLKYYFKYIYYFIIIIFGYCNLNFIYKITFEIELFLQFCDFKYFNL